MIQGPHEEKKKCGQDVYGASAMVEEDNKKFDARQLVTSFMDSSFESNPDEWTGIINIEKALDKAGILVHEVGKYHSPKLMSFREALEDYRKGKATIESVRQVLSVFIDSIGRIEHQIEGMSPEGKDSSFIEHLNEIRKITEFFTESLKKIEAHLDDSEIVDTQLRILEDHIEARSASAHESLDERTGESSTRITTFCMAAGQEKKGIRIFSSPSYDLINNAIFDFKEGHISNAQCVQIISDVLEGVTGLFEFCNGELNALKEEDPEMYSSYREIVAALSRSQRFTHDGFSRVMSYFEAGVENGLDQGLEIFFKGLQEMALVWTLLDQMKRIGF